MMRHSQRQPFTIADTCDTECGLCSTLGCLRPERIDWATFVSELESMQLADPREIVFSPNALTHPDLDSMVHEIRRRGLEPVVRIRPAQVIEDATLLESLDYRGARFEVVIDRPVSEREFAAIERLTSGIVRTTVVLNRSIDAAAVIEALPARLRSTAGLLAPLEEGERFFGPDEIYRLLKTPELADLPTAGLLQSQSRFFETGVRSTPLVRRNGPSKVVRASVVVPFHEGNPIPCLDALAEQTLDPNLFEIIVACDRAETSAVKAIETWMRVCEPDMNVSLLSLDSIGVSPREFRAGLARNAGAWHATGDLLIFLDADAIAPRGLLNDALEAAKSADLIQYERRERGVETERYWREFYSRRDWDERADKWRFVSSFALAVKTASFIRSGGFPSALNRYGCEDTMIGWTLAHIGVRFELRHLQVEHGGRSGSRRLTTRAKMKKIAASARAFYLCTLDPRVYSIFYPVMGRFPEARWALRALAGATT